MPDVSTVSVLNGLFKSVYDDGLQNYLPESNILQRAIGFNKAKKIGKKFEAAVLVASENGLSFGAGDADGFELNAPSSLETVGIAVNGSSVLAEGRVGYLAAEKSKGSQAAFKEVTGLKVQELAKSIRRGVEISLWAGQSGLGASTGAASAGVDNGDGTYRTTVALSAATTAHGFWVGARGMRIVFYTAANVVKGGYTGAVARVTPAGVFKVVSYDPTPANPTITIDGAQADVAALVTDTTAAALTVYRYGTVQGTAGTFASREMAGLEKILSTQSGTLFEASLDQYDVLRATKVSSVAKSVAGILGAVAKAHARGFEGDSICFVPVDVFNTLATSSDILGARQFDASYKPQFAELGVDGIVLHGLSGKVEVVPSSMCKNGQAVVIVKSLWSRIGAVDFTMQNPNGEKGDIFFHDPTNSAFAYRGYSHQAVYCKQPSKGGLLIQFA